MMDKDHNTSSWYFSRFEHRKPEPASQSGELQMFLTQILSVCALALGAWYLFWRWTDSLNPDALGFSIVLAIAESLAFVGSVLFTFNLWRVKDTPWRSSPSRLSEIRRGVSEDGAVVVDVFYPTYNEDEELVRLSLQDAKRMRVPKGLDVRIHVLDDGNRGRMREVAEEEGVNYLARADNIGFKAGNIRNGMRYTEGHLMVIFDADTRPFPEFLERTLGYFRDADVAWVQTPQWFFDYQEGIPLPVWLSKGWHLGVLGRVLGQGVERCIGPIHVNRDLLGNDPSMFYDVILRRRNPYNASFCCGAGSIHRREAIMNQALKRYVDAVQTRASGLADYVQDASLKESYQVQVQLEAARRTEVMPYLFHVSEDIYTGIYLHADEHKTWKSVYHPEVLSKMLSPQELLSWSIQRFKYAGGTLDIMRQDNPLGKKGLSLGQRWMYGATMYSYLAPLWIIPFLIAPIIFFFTGIAPIAAYDGSFYMHLLPFLLVSRLAVLVGTWGVPSLRGEQYYLAFFWQNITAMWEVLCRQPIKFHVTPKIGQAGHNLNLVWPQLLLIGASLCGAAYMGWQVWLGVEQHVPAYLVNLFWTFNNCLALSIIVRAAWLRGEE